MGTVFVARDLMHWYAGRLALPNNSWANVPKVSRNVSEVG